MSNLNGHFDVIIIGGGPGGSTTGALLRKYNPNLRVLILERETFPRDHIGESQLPPIGRVLHEMGVWDKIERHGFPIKLGATYTWGKTISPWTFGFIPDREIPDSYSRPGTFEGWRQRVSFQVDRSIYDTILLDHAKELGCDVRQAAKVKSITHDRTKAGKRVTGVELESGEKFTARYYVDASGNAAVMRRALGIKVDAPTLLRNVAFWDYWSAPGMNKAILEKKAVRIQIRSLPYGWVWYIALSDDRTSVGLVCNAEWYKTCGKRPDDLLMESLRSEATVWNLIKDATRKGKLESTTDWSYVADETCGENWFLVGECLGFADPILSAGLTLTHTCAQHAASTILELDHGEEDAAWLRREYNNTQRRRVIQHMKFAEYWYTGNGQFSAVRENCAAIAKEAGLTMSPEEAFRWLSHGGIDDHVGQFAIGGLGLSGVKSVQMRLSHDHAGDVTYTIDGATDLVLNLRGATRTDMAHPENGRVIRLPILERGKSRVPLTGTYAAVVEVLKRASTVDMVLAGLQEYARRHFATAMDARGFLSSCTQSMEALASQGWIEVRRRPNAPAISLKTPEEGEIVYSEEKGPTRVDRGLI
ncbi:MAG: hypothetical protein HBSAPP03_23730 [Phycisphaerae bacterium]|nr:MAG: hypothetical protein HBSAPP03_23730 [Phycisphaerae bacterium]